MSATITERYEGVVTSIEDDEQRGRIQVTCPGLTGDESTVLPFLIEPTLDWGWFVIPNVDETVEIEIIASSPQDEINGQASLEAINARWRSKRFTNEGAPTHPDFIAANYGQRRGFSTPQGHIIIIDDKAGTVRMSWMLTPDAADSARSSILFDEDGKIHLIHKADHKITLEESKVTITLAGGNSLTLENNEGNATAKVGNGAMHVAIVEHLETLYGAMKTAFDTHTHPVPALGLIDSLVAPVTGAATSSPPASPLPGWDGSINSSKVSIPDG